MIEDPRDPGLGRHLSPEDLAVLAEGGDRDRPARAANEHLVRCRSCMAAYTDIVRYRAAWLAFPEAFGGGRATPPNRHGWVSMAAAVVVLFGLGVAWLGGRVGPRPDAGSITAILERASAEGLVIPGGEAGAAGSSSPYRSVPAVDDEALRALERLRQEYEKDGQHTREVHRLAAGLLASGRPGLASSYLDDWLTRAPDDCRLLTLAAIAAHRNGDLPGAERRLRKALTTSPGDLTAMLDLGLVLVEMRDFGRAKPFLNAVIREAPGSELAKRAQRALADPPRP